MENNDKFLSQDLLESYAIRLLSGPLNGCEYEILNGRLLVIIGNDVSLGRSDAFSELPENTIVVPYGELTGSFEIIITTDPDLVVTFRELTAQEPEDRTLTLNQQIEVLGLKFAVKEKNEVWQYSLPGIIENNIISTKQHFFSSKLFKYVMLFFLFAIIFIAFYIVNGFAPIFPDTCYHLTHYWPAAADIPVASDNPVHYADAIRYNARTPLQGSLLPLTRLV